MGLMDYVVFPAGEGGFARDRVESVLGLWDDARASEGLIGSKGSVAVDNGYRRSTVQWIGPGASPDVFTHFFRLATAANEQCGWNFELAAMSPALQLTQYDAALSGHYEWHLDLGPDETALRKVSLVALLSDPTTFMGGYLQIFTGRTEQTVGLELGSIVVFPSYFLHRVTPLFEGTRRTFVGWGCGHFAFR